MRPLALCVSPYAVSGGWFEAFDPGIDALAEPPATALRDTASTCDKRYFAGAGGNGGVGAAGGEEASAAGRPGSGAGLGFEPGAGGVGAAAASDCRSSGTGAGGAPDEGRAGVGNEGSSVRSTAGEGAAVEAETCGLARSSAAPRARAAPSAGCRTTLGADDAGVAPGGPSTVSAMLPLSVFRTKL
jgi:hypothetical protein